MGLRLLLSTPVRAFEASRFDGHIGTIFSVDPAVPDKGIADTIEASVLSIRRRDGAVTIRFGAAPLDWIQIAGLQFRVRPFKARPLQCSQCGGYNHVAASCTRSQRCTICSGPHHHRDCTAEVPRCLHCRGHHRAVNHARLRWKEQSQLGDHCPSRDCQPWCPPRLHGRAPPTAPTQQGTGARDSQGPQLRPSPAVAELQGPPPCSPDPSPYPDRYPGRPAVGDDGFAAGRPDPPATSPPYLRGSRAV
ncbi:hypothetical protein V5799_002571 [Amblyomma americanum]|uniref:Tick transposon n=1 Tax=Amblyomma americanum TaxID=6943 RepID=A0AAQ4CWY5_AMBAM